MAATQELEYHIRFYEPGPIIVSRSPIGDTGKLEVEEYTTHHGYTISFVKSHGFTADEILSLGQLIERRSYKSDSILLCLQANIEAGRNAQ